MMKKQLISIACGVLCCSMLFAACNKGTAQGISTTAKPSEILTTTEPGTTAAGTTQGTTKGSTTKVSTTKVSTTKKKIPSTTKKSGSSSGKKKPVNKPDKKPVTTNSSKPDDDRYTKLPVKFNSLSEYKAIAKANQNRSGCDLFKDKKVIYPTFDNMDVVGMVDIEEVSFEGGFCFAEDPNTSYDIDYYVNLTKSTSHDLTEFAGPDFMDYAQSVNYQGTTYYIAMAGDENRPDVYVYAFVGDYCTLSLFSAPPIDRMGLLDFAELSTFKSASF